MESVKYEEVYPCKHNHSINHSKALLTSRRKKKLYALLNPEADGRKGKQKRDKTNYLIKQQLKQITISMMLSRGTSCQLCNLIVID
jgi:hypothetical protein